MIDRGLDTAVHGATVDDQTRCVHWHGPTDVIAIRFRCCDRFYPCRECHDDEADHAASLWPSDRDDEPVVLCGVCGGLLTTVEYRAVDACPSCGAAFNPGCRTHAHLYFEAADRTRA